MNRKTNSVLTLDLTIRFKRQIALSDLLKWALPVALALGQLAARLHGGP
jgi:hypothetical protein